MENNVASSGYIWYTSSYTSGTTSAWPYLGEASYLERGHDGNCIRVDKGSPDKAKHVIFYAEIDESGSSTDPMIFCKDEKQLNTEMKKLLKRKDIDKTSIRVFNLTGGIKKL